MRDVLRRFFAWHPQPARLQVNHRELYSTHPSCARAPDAVSDGSTLSALAHLLRKPSGQAESVPAPQLTAAYFPRGSLVDQHVQRMSPAVNLRNIHVGITGEHGRGQKNARFSRVLGDDDATAVAHLFGVGVVSNGCSGRTQQQNRGGAGRECGSAHGPSNDKPGDT